MKYGGNFSTFHPILFNILGVIIELLILLKLCVLICLIFSLLSCNNGKDAPNPALKLKAPEQVVKHVDTLDIGRRNAQWASQRAKIKMRAGMNQKKAKYYWKYLMDSLNNMPDSVLKAEKKHWK